MDKQNIEEIAKEICPHYYNGNCYYEVSEVCECCCGCEFCWAVMQVLNAGYRKIPENAVALTREELEQIKGFSREEVDEISETAIKNSRKETAEKIFDKLYTWLDLEEIEKYGFVHIQKFDFLRKFREICKEITEGK